MTVIYATFSRMKIAIAQIDPYLGNIEKNLKRHLDLVEEAISKKADLIVFPELSLTGYTLRDGVPDMALKPGGDTAFNKLIASSKGISIAFGFAEEKDPGLFFNSSAFLSGGKTLHIHRKVYLPNYGIFEELKFFGQGRNFHTFSSPFGKTGMLICYDFLHYGASYLLFAGGSEFIIVLSAAPGRGVSSGEGWASSYMWELMGETISRFSQSFVIYANRVGSEDGKSFAGGSFIYSPAGQLLAKASYSEEEFLVREVDIQEIREMRRKWPYKRDEKPEIICEALKRIVAGNED